MPVFSVTRFERFFHEAAGLRMDKNDLKRFEEFLDRKVQDLFVAAGATAKANGRDVIEPTDLPITKGLQECVREFRKLDEELDVAPMLAQVIALPPAALPAIGDEARDRLPGIAGGLGVALARAFPIVAPSVKNPRTAEWDQVFALFDLLL
jgi:hypothetical protein